MKSILLQLDQVRIALQKRTGVTKNKKCREAWEAKGYNPDPCVTFIIQSHNKSLQVEHIVRKLRQQPQAEIIVIDDGSAPLHTRRLTRLLTGANEYLLRCNDLYEVITYDRACRMARGRYVALLQDDDDFNGTGWVDEAVKLFSQHEKMVILGGNLSLGLVFDKEKRCAYGKRFDARAPFDFVPTVNRAPMLLNRELYLDVLGGTDKRFAPFQYDDYEVCARAWLSGLKVGLYNANFFSLSGGV